jgi:spermidine/putrescine transport system permease protein
MTDVLRRYGATLTGCMLLATALWLLVMVLLPYFVMVHYSFRPNLLPADLGTDKDHYTGDNYLTLFRNSIHFWVFVRTIWGSALATFLCLIVAYPVAYFLAKMATPQRAALVLLLLVIPFWINEILRTFAWFIILAYNGPLNGVLRLAGVIQAPIRWLSGSNGVIAGMTYAYTVFMVFPIYNAIDTLDRNQIEAARDLGAPLWRIHWRVVIPHAKPGIAVGCILVYTAAAGSYIVPAILGAPGTRWFTEIIYQWFFEGQNWPQGSAYAFLLLVLCLAFVFAMMRLFRVGLSDIAK